MGIRVRKISTIKRTPKRNKKVIRVTKKRKK